MRIIAISKRAALVQLRQALVAYFQNGEYSPLTTEVQSQIEEKARTRYAQELSVVKDLAVRHIGLPLATADIDLVNSQIRSAYTQADMLAMAVGATYTLGSGIHPQIACLIRQVMRLQARNTMEETKDPSILDGLARIKDRDNKLWSFWAGGQDRSDGPEYMDLIIMNAARKIMADNNFSFKRMLLYKQKYNKRGYICLNCQ